MNANNSMPPNPIVYLNYLPPEIASDYELSHAIYVVTLGAMLWDIFSCLPQDWELLRTSKITPPYVAYHISRWFALAAVILLVATGGGSFPHCQAAQAAIYTCIFLTNIASDFLFLTRVQAVYHSNKRVRLIFLFLWIADVCCMALIFWGTHVTSIADTAYCIDVGAHKFLSVTMFMPLLFETMVFIFITVKLMTMRYPTEKFNYRMLLSAATLPHLSRSIFISGQRYYLIRICCSILIIPLWLVDSVPAVLKPAFTTPTVAVTSSMACRVYRNLRLQLYDNECPETSALTTNVAVGMHTGPNEGDRFQG